MRSAKGELTGAHVLGAMLAFFAVVIAINVGFTIAAVRTFPGEDVRRSYLQGLQYNDTLAERRAEAETGWSTFAELTAQGAGALVRVTMTDTTGAPLAGMTVEGELRRPAESARDQALVFNESTPGVYTARVAALEPGQWIVRGSATRDGAQRSFERRLTWRSR